MSDMDLPSSASESHRLGQDDSVHDQLQGAKRLYVWFHGLFGFYFRGNHVLVVTPEMKGEHKYLAGSWGGEHPLEEGAKYCLHGVSTPGRTAIAPAINPEKAAVLSGISKVDFGSSYFQIELPFPKQIIPVRYVHAKFTGRSSSQLHSPFPLVHIFEYNIVDPSLLSLPPLPGWPIKISKCDNDDLHVFAEPDRQLRNEHAIHAFTRLTAMFPDVDLQLEDSSFCGSIPLDPNLPPGLSPDKELSLSERETKSGTQPANCFGLIVKP